MKTLLQCIDQLIENISVTDRQEESIKGSYDNLEDNLFTKENNLHVVRVFQSGSYYRDTIIRPLDDIDLFAVLNTEKYEDEFGNLPTPQSVLTRMKNYLNSVEDYKGKVKQDRPCVTVILSDKNFDVLPCFKNTISDYYSMPNENLTGWTLTSPIAHTTRLDEIHKNRKYKLKSLIKVIKYWNRENNKYIPSYHVEEIAMSIFDYSDFKNYEEGILKWFQNAALSINSSKLRSYDDYETVVKKINKVKTKLEDAHEKYEKDKQGDALLIWKDIFGKEFPTVDVEEAKNFGQALKEGTLKIGSTGMISTTFGRSISPSTGHFGDEV